MTEKRIKTYCRSTQEHNRPSSLGKLSIEKLVLENSKNNSQFYNKVVQKCVEMKRRVDFIFV